MRAIALLLGLFIVAAGCSEKTVTPASDIIVPEAPSTSEPAPTPAEQQDAVATVNEEFIPEDDAVDIGSMI